MSDKYDVTFEVAATIDNTTGLYDALQRKFNLAMFRQHKNAPIAYFADITTDAKQTAKYQYPSIDLRYFSPVLMAENYKIDYNDFKRFQIDMAVKLQAYVGCFLTVDFIEFLICNNHLSIDALVDVVTRTIVLIDDLLQFNPTDEQKSDLISLKYFCSDWLTWAIWKRTTAQMKAGRTQGNRPELPCAM